MHRLENYIISEFWSDSDKITCEMPDTGVCIHLWRSCSVRGGAALSWQIEERVQLFVFPQLGAKVVPGEATQIALKLKQEVESEISNDFYQKPNWGSDFE